MTKVKVGILGATGTVGQRFIELLSKHPQFIIHSVGASSRSAGKKYSEATKWKITGDIPEQVKNMVVKVCKAELFGDCEVIFSGLDSDVAGEIEMEFLKADFVVFSNAKNYRRDPIVPLIVPTVNPAHFNLIPHQRSIHTLQKGFLVTNSNCSTTGLVVALKPLQDAFGPLETIIVQTMQAISGAGYPGVSSLDIFDNVIPFISGEEEKMEYETLKILGDLNSDQTECKLLDSTNISATCNRVPVIDGHTECVSIKFKNQPPPTPQEIINVLDSYVSEAQQIGCHSAPNKCIIIRNDDDRPQPRLDRNNGDGYSVTIGRVRKCNVFDIKFTLLVHNTILGAAGSGILNAEIALAKGVEIQVNGWIRTVRIQKNVSFASINDGSSLKGLQAILSNEDAKKLTTGTCVRLHGVLVDSIGKEQNKELQVNKVEILGECDSTYPLQKKNHSMEFLRETTHLRFKTNIFSAILRVRNSTILGFQEFFQVHTPIITTSDCEGGGEVFKLTTVNSEEFFGKPVYLTVSGQLHAESISSSISRVYSIGPIFRADKSLTSKHLSEFWMLESEISFIDSLKDLNDFIENSIKYVIQFLLNNSYHDLEYFNQFIDDNLLNRLEHTLKIPFITMSYNDAINILSKNSFDISFGSPIQSQHEKFLSTNYCNSPLFIINYPKEIKPFYMRFNDDNKTVACTDLLLPKIGELVGGSLREERYSLLENNILIKGSSLDDYKWYLDLRKYGSFPHGGFGMGIERFLLYITGLDNIKDVIPFPRSTNYCKF
ncbi:4176_t:CDS:2 [Funneliformis mosseae]|uniref:Asparagine--tRNA ligase, mitochondrial n=1 Tax=Funneliformis mosseae TaxID=27381 RepID=A0A9N9AHL6_FUNMO|nr:4176_t:CDS:2 [Funneliformis mosseae]